MSSARRLARRILGPAQFDEIEVVHRLAPKQPQVMLDVGAHHGTALLRFAQESWHVHSFEPDTHNRNVLMESTARHPSVVVDERAVSDVDDRTLTLYRSAVSTGISTLTPFHPSHQEGKSVRSVRLDTYLQEHGSQQVGVLKIDAEGHDFAVLKGFP